MACLHLLVQPFQLICAEVEAEPVKQQKLDDYYTLKFTK